MGFQAAVVGGLEGAELAAERLVVTVVGLHVAVQAGGDTEKGGRKGRQKRVNCLSCPFRGKAKHFIATTEQVKIISHILSSNSTGLLTQ